MVLTADRLGLAAGQVSPERLQAVRAAILVWLWARAPCPTQIRAPSVLSNRPRFQHWPRIRVLILPSHSVRHLMVRRTPPAVFDGMLGFGWFAFAGMTCCGRRGRARHPPRPARRSHGPR